jgi:hypothetical protein
LEFSFFFEKKMYIYLGGFYAEKNLFFAPCPMLFGFVLGIGFSNVLWG